MLRTLLMFLLLTMSSLTMAADQHKPLVLNSYKDAYNAIHKYSVPGIIIFHADCCDPCQRMKKDTWAPLMPGLRKNYIVYFLNVDEEKDAVAQWKKQDARFVASLPAYAFVSQGGSELIAYGQGYRNKTDLVKWAKDKVAAWNARQKTQPKPGS